MSQINQALYAVLRRQARSLDKHLDGNAGHVVAVEADQLSKVVSNMISAADEIEVRRRCVTPEDGENVAAQAIAECRRLRNVLVDVHNELKRGTVFREELVERCKAALKSIPEAGKDRRVLAVTVGDNATRESLLEDITAALDAHFGPKPIGVDVEFELHVSECAICRLNPETLCHEGRRLLAESHGDTAQD